MKLIWLLLRFRSGAASGGSTANALLLDGVQLQMDGVTLVLV